MKDVGTAGGEGMSFIIAQVVEESGCGRIARVGSVNTVHIGPDDEFFGIEDVRDDGARVVGTVTAEGGDAAVGSGADEAGDHGNEAGVKQRVKRGTTALSGLLKVRLGFEERVAGEHKVGRSDRNGRDARFFERGGKEARAETLAEGRQAIGKLGAGRNAAERRNFVEKVAAEKLQTTADAVMLFVRETEILKHIGMKEHEPLRIVAGAGKFPIGESADDGKKAVGNALHGRDNHDHMRRVCGGADETCGVKHALGTEKRGTAELEGNDGARQSWREAFIRSFNKGHDVSCPYMASES
jgi:hypothetical protein